MEQLVIDAFGSLILRYVDLDKAPNLTGRSIQSNSENSENLPLSEHSSSQNP